MVPLTPLETDILGDMAWDSHFVGEIVGFVRSTDAYADDFSVYRQTVALLEAWTERGWLQLADKPTLPPHVRTMEQLLAEFSHEGVRAVSDESVIAHIEIDLTDQAFRDVEWLRGAV
jgi:hypothetical protein